MEFKNSREVEEFYMGKLEQARDQQEQDSLKEREAVAFDTFFKRNQKVARNEANEQLFRNYLDGIEATVASLEEVLALLDLEEKPRYAVWDAYHEHQFRQELIRAIVKEDPRIFGQDANGQRVETERLNFFETVDLRQRLDNVRTEKRLRSMSIPELKAERAASKPKVQGPPPLPERFSAAIIKCMSVPQIRSLISTYSEARVNERLQGIS